MVKRFQRLGQVSFPLIDPDLRYWYIIWKINTTNRGLNLKKHLHTIPRCLGFHVKTVFFFKKLLVVICFWVNVVQKLKIISLSWNFLPRLIQICRIPWWCSLFLFSTGNTSLDKFDPKNQNCHFELKFCTRPI